MRNLIQPIIIVTLLTANAHSEPLTDEEVFDVMYQVDNLDDGDNFYASVELSVADRNGKTTQYKMQQMRRYTDPLRSVRATRSYFTEPKEVAGVSVLSHDHRENEKVDERWISIPGIDNIKRMTSTESGNLMGSDISHSDLDSRVTRDYDYRYLSERTIDKWDTWEIEFKPKSKTIESRFGYSKGVVYVDKASLLVVKAIFWISSKQNVLKFYELDRMEKISGVWTPVSLVFYTKRSGVLLGKTVMKLSEIQYNMGYRNEHFVPTGLKEPLPDVVLGLE